MRVRIGKSLYNFEKVSYVRKIESTLEIEVNYASGGKFIDRIIIFEDKLSLEKSYAKLCELLLGNDQENKVL